MSPARERSSRGRTADRGGPPPANGFQRRFSFRGERIVFDLVCVLLILAATYLAQLIRLGNEIFIFSRHTGGVAITAFVYLVYLYIFNVSNITFRMAWFEAAFRGLVVTGCAIVTSAFAFYALPQWSFGRGLLLIQGGLIWVLVTAWRMLLTETIAKVPARKEIIILGTGKSAQGLTRLLATSNSPYQAVGYIDLGEPGGEEAAGPSLGRVDALPKIAAAHKVDTLILASDGAPPPETVRLVLAAKMRGLEIIDYGSLVERLTGRVPFESLPAQWFISNSRSNGAEGGLYDRIKRLLDVAAALVFLPLVLPLTILAGLAILLTSGRPVMIKQQRVGRFGRVFNIRKLRTMRPNSENGQAVWTEPGDPRVTPPGRILRRLRLDELPQLVNVFRGEMSLVGPRPEQTPLVKELEREIKHYHLRHLIKPGLTGWAQIEAPYGSTRAETVVKLEYDFYYLKKRSLLFDIKILLRTVGVVIFGDGAR